jgi:hypothetical protein
MTCVADDSGPCECCCNLSIPHRESPIALDYNDSKNEMKALFLSVRLGMKTSVTVPKGWNNVSSRSFNSDVFNSDETPIQEQPTHAGKVEIYGCKTKARKQMIISSTDSSL